MKALGVVAVGLAVTTIMVLSFVLVFRSFNTGAPPMPPQPTSQAVSTNASAASSPPTLSDPRLKAELVANGMDFPTSMAFVDDKGSLLVLEKNTGKVLLINNGTTRTVLKLNVATGAEQGLLGVAVTGKNPEYVFLYLTEVDQNNYLLNNNIYRYEWNPERMNLENPKLVYKFPAAPGPIHNGGKMTIDRSGHVFATIGNLNRASAGPLCNQKSGEIDDTCVIIRMDTEGRPLSDNPFVSYGKRTIDYYYAYGIRNSFGLDVDPLTGILWATENGVATFDEINVVQPGFNSGWEKLMGPMSQSNVTQQDLFFLNGAKYADPVFSWKHSIGVTAIKFFNSTQLGEKYVNNIFVGDYNAGNLYFFVVNKERNGLVLQGDLSDKIADSYDESLQVRLGVFPGGIVDLQTGPDGYLYVLTFSGNVYRVMPK